MDILSYILGKKSGGGQPDPQQWAPVRIVSSTLDLAQFLGAMSWTTSAEEKED